VPAYVIAWLTVSDRAKMERYRAAVPEVVAKYGGTYLAVGPGTEALEGDWRAHGVALLAFPTREDAITWYDSAEYRPLRELRGEAADSVLLLTPDWQPEGG
jgi:uncharacterized protein (DUF1330 family)